MQSLKSMSMMTSAKSNLTIPIPQQNQNNPHKPQPLSTINVLNPEKHGGDGLNNSYISYEITSTNVKSIKFN